MSDKAKGERRDAFLGKIMNVYDYAKLDLAEAQRVNESPGLDKLVRDFIAKYRGVRFPDEEVRGTAFYRSGYFKPKPLDEQVRILKEHFPGLGDYDPAFAQEELPEDAEGYFAFPNYGYMPDVSGDGIRKIVSRLAKRFPTRFGGIKPHEYGPDFLRRSQLSKAFWERITWWQYRRIIVLPAQFGMRHIGRSPRRAIEAMKSDEQGRSEEFPLGAFEVAIMLLTHPERLKDDRDPGLLCAGDQTRWHNDEKDCFARVPEFFLNHKFYFSNGHGISQVSSRAGVPSAWLKTGVGFRDPNQRGL